MKNSLFILATLLFTINLHAQTTAIPDTNFEQHLINLGLDDVIDGQVLTANINTVTSLIIYPSTNNPTDLTGIEDFTTLEDFTASSLGLTFLDLSNNTNLINVDISNNVTLNLPSSLDFSNSPNLTNLNVSFTAISNLETLLDISSNANLESLNISFNGVNTLDLSANTSLTSLNARDNSSLSVLNASNLASLVNLNLVGSTNLTDIRVNGTAIPLIDVRQQSNLTHLDVSNNSNLTTLVVKNGANTNLTNANFISTSTPNLSCIEVDDVTYSNTTWTNIDAVNTFSTDCGFGTFVPDDNFENYLETHDANGNPVFVGDPTGMGNGIANDNTVYTSRINTVTNLNIHSRNISNTQGLEGFTALEVLGCGNNQITTLDLSANSSLREIDAISSQISSLTLPSGNNLMTLYVSSNLLTTIDVSQNPELITLLCQDNLLNSINISTNTKLEELDISDNSISSLDVTNNTDLTVLACANNNIPTINLLSNPTLTELFCNNNGITALNLSANSQLRFLNADNNILTSIDLSQNTALEIVILENNQLTSIDTSTNTNLTGLGLANNQLSTIDLSSNTALDVVRLNMNFFTSLNLDNNINLTYFECSDNSNLTQLSFNIPDYTNITDFIATNNPLLNCIDVISASYSTSNWTNIDAHTSFNTNCASTLASPSITNCPGDQNVTADCDTFYEVPDYAASTTATDSDSTTITYTQTPQAGYGVVDGTVVTITATDEVGNTDTCTFILNVTQETLSSDQLDDVVSRQIALFPNPSKGIFTLKNTSGLLLETGQVIDAKGTLVKTVDLSSYSPNKTIDLGGLSAGIYLFKINTIDGYITKKVSIK